jgi:hypothetical protein
MLIFIDFPFMTTSSYFLMHACCFHLQIVLLTHRNALCWVDEWFGLTFEEVLVLFPLISEWAS